MVVDLGYLDSYRITDRHDVLHFSYAFRGQLGNMHQTVFPRQNLDESAEFFNPFDGAYINFTDHDFLDDPFDNRTRFAVHLFVRRSDKYAAVLFDIDFHAGFFDDLVDDLAACPDDIADLVRIDVHDNDLRRVRRQMLLRLLNALHHFGQDKHPTFSGLFQSIGQNLPVDSVDLDIHLNSRNAFRSACYFEVHVAEMIFHPLNVSQDRHVLAVFNQTHSHPGNRSFDRNARIHHGQRAGADARLGRRTVGFQYFRYKTNRIREFGFRRNHLRQRAFA
ncbi:hypothetical protein D3C74_251860 [compost metagenome]